MSGDAVWTRMMVFLGCDSMSNLTVMAFRFDCLVGLMLLLALSRPQWRTSTLAI